MKCASCHQPKNEVHVHKSRLFTDMQLVLCNACWTGGFEPRWLIILYGRQNGPASVEKYIKNHLYYGDPVLATELI